MRSFCSVARKVLVESSASDSDNAAASSTLANRLGETMNEKTFMVGSTVDVMSTMYNSVSFH